MEDDGCGGRIVHQVSKFVSDVAVVHIERSAASQVGADHALEVFRAVIERQGDMVLARFMAGQSLALSDTSQALTSEV